MAPGSAAALVPADAKSKTLNVATDASYPPFEFFDTDNKTIIGFDVDLLKAAAGKMGVKVDIQNVTFDSIIPGIDAKKYDLSASAFSVTDERRKTVDFIGYLAGGTGVAVPKANPRGLKFDDPTDLCGTTLAVEKGTIQADYLVDWTKSCEAAGKSAVTALVFGSQNEANLAVSSGRAQGTVADGTTLQYITDKSGGKLTMLPSKQYKPATYGVVFPKGSSLEPAFAEAVKELLADGTLASLLKKWDVPDSALDTSVVGKIYS